MHYHKAATDSCQPFDMSANNYIGILVHQGDCRALVEKLHVGLVDDDNSIKKLPATATLQYPPVLR
jgi:hypothetical protein